MVAPMAAAAQGIDSQAGRLRVAVLDPSGAVIPGALVNVAGAENRNKSVMRTDVPTDKEGVALFEGLPAGRYNITVLFEGFESVGVMDLRLKAGENMRRDVTLPIKGVDESVAVGRDPATNASDPNSGRFDTTLSKDQINALPDDPDEMAKVLEEMAGPGATMRVDGFRGGRLPPKEQIRSIRFNRDPFSAENHGSGMVFIDIITQPGIGPLRGGMNFNFADDSLNARTASQPTKGDERQQGVGFNLSGTIAKNKTSFNLSANVSSNYRGSEVFARTLDGPVAFSLRQPNEMYSFNGRVDHAVSKAHTLRANIQANQFETEGGVGGFSLREMGTLSENQSAILRLSDTGPWGKKLFNETRLQIGMNSSTSRAAVEGQTIRVLDSFTGGGAQTQGGNDVTNVEFASNVDYVKGKHSFRFGTLAEGQWVTSDRQQNYLGTFTFASLDDYAARRPSTFSRRDGNPLVDYTQFQVGFFAQDDWRARQNLTISMGVRQEMQTHLDDKWNLSPRFGFTWSPLKSGKTVVRGSLGIFTDWLEANVYEQVLQVDGVRQFDTVVTNPGFPDPFAGGLLQNRLPASRYVFADDLSMPWSTRMSLGLQQQLPIAGLGSNVLYSFSRGYDRFRGRNINAPVNGVRPDPAFGNITQVESTGGQRQHMVHAGLNYMTQTGLGFIGRTFFNGNYTINHTENDSASAFGLPADNYNLDAEWGPSGQPRHSLGANATTMLFKKLNVGFNASWRSGVQYNVTTGRDDNGDTVFNDRPAGFGRNSATGDWTFNLGGNLSYSFGFGRRPGAEGGPGGTTVVMGGPGGMSMPAGAQMMMGGGPMGTGSSRYSVNLFINGSNLLNTVNPMGYSGVQTSTLFGQPTGAARARSVTVGARFGF
ncbi:MAG: TonB-dependent receptor [Acidobacteriota bacterium]|nr:TonB-dependent receptor [Acidobacteriota bacterium]